MKKFYVEGYWKGNLGDDLFLKILCERYPECNFTIIADFKYRETYNFENIEFISEKKDMFTKINNKLRSYTNQLKAPVKNLKFDSYNGFIELGGSLFMLPKNGKLSDYNYKQRQKFIQKFKSGFIIGSNFGPFSSQYQLRKYFDLFKKYNGIVFRDSFSYSLFNNLKNIDWAPDVVFGLSESIKDSHKEDTPAYIVISVIDINRKLEKDTYSSTLEIEYYNKLIEFINNAVLNEKNVILFSFCEFENDYNVCLEIFNRLNEKQKKYVTVYNHKNIDNSLKIISNAERIIASRFHAMILGWVYEIPTMVISYSKKIENVINDSWPEQKFQDIHQVKELNIKDIFMAEKIPQHIVNEYKMDSRRHFEFLNEYIENN